MPESKEWRRSRSARPVSAATPARRGRQIPRTERATASMPLRPHTVRG